MVNQLLARAAASADHRRLDTGAEASNLRYLIVLLIYCYPDINKITVVDPHHVGAGTDSAYHLDADPNSDFFI
jgi:hypothetical protein